MLDVAVLGATGRMGREVVRRVTDAPDLRLVAACTRAGSASIGEALGGLSVTAIGPALAAARPDVVIDFSLPPGLTDALPHLGTTPVVSGTTGLDATALAQLDAYASAAPVMLAANFSVGVNLLLALVEAGARALPDFDVEIVELHHRRKVDAPSGTALALAEAAASARGWSLEAVRADGRSGSAGERPAAQIGLHAVRGGSVTGHHAVHLLGEHERLVLTHDAASRGVFADGALRAARWIVGRPPARYTMRDLLG